MNRTRRGAASGCQSSPPAVVVAAATSGVARGPSIRQRRAVPVQSRVHALMIISLSVHGRTPAGGPLLRPVAAGRRTAENPSAPLRVRLRLVRAVPGDGLGQAGLQAGGGPPAVEGLGHAGDVEDLLGGAVGLVGVPDDLAVVSGDVVD